MQDEYLNVEVGDEFEYQGRRYCKLDDRRAWLLDGEPSSDEKVIHFYPEDRVHRKDIPMEEVATHGQKLPGRSRLRNGLFWMLCFGFIAILVAIIISGGWLSLG
ncbi:hypothetical protein RMSM_02557 [Rhodopirellula maiorica SM1]|uniref:Uncharacterized protein n=1 Tax=Rhodopirellula maiorica SM1 TaxID=1265738 RepID=M5RMJ3_9BACT|nr:hypothetical protein [Rhodopirellula maiorica]EMI20525.1 hypothetical protein RMSM_02557 [Rhodopirellula maiorica SM1]